ECALVNTSAALHVCFSRRDKPLKRLFRIALLLVTAVPMAEAARPRRVVVRGPRVRVTVRPGFPIRRALPNVVVRPAPLFRVSPRVYLSPLVFRASVVALPAGTDWRPREDLDRGDGWTALHSHRDRP